MTAAKNDTNDAEIKGLGDLSKIPQKEFEKHFRDWMDRDGVARALQAKLRSDLISNFNKTTLGKQINAQTATACRLTLSPIILALNTLVAEFLYAQNCHFSLSVFCTEVPFRNTLPDFESQRYFRFTEFEISEICEAVSVQFKNDQVLKKQICRNYTANTTASLLFLILKALLDKAAEVSRKTVTVATNTKPMIAINTPTHAEEKPTGADDQKDEYYNTNFAYLNKYLIILSRKVKEMSQQFENLQQQRNIDARVPRRKYNPKTVNSRRYENLNRSLERITENLKQMTHAKRKSKQVNAIVDAIGALSEQFGKCATNFDNVSRKLVTARRREAQAEWAMSSATSNKSKITAPRSQRETQTDAQEKSYMDWVNEMRYTSNGQKFLDRIEASLRKALDKQKQELAAETELKLRHQKEILRIHYKQKLMQQLTKQTSAENTEDVRKMGENIEEQLKKFEEKHLQLLSKIYETTDVEPKKSIAPATTNLKSLENPGSVYSGHQQTLEDFSEISLTRKRSNILASDATASKKIQTTDAMRTMPNCFTTMAKDALNTQAQLQSMVRSITEQGRNTDQIVYDAKLRIQQLENESNQLEQNFLNYLARQRQEKEATRNAATEMWQSYVNEREKMRERYAIQAPNTSKGEKQKQHHGVSTVETAKISTTSSVRSSVSNDDGAADKRIFEVVNLIKSNKHKNDGVDWHRNAILEAKEKFLEHDRQSKERAERLFLTSMPKLNLDNFSDDDDVYIAGMINTTSSLGVLNDSHNPMVSYDLHRNYESLVSTPTAATVKLTTTTPCFNGNEKLKVLSNITPSEILSISTTTINSTKSNLLTARPSTENSSDTTIQLANIPQRSHDGDRNITKLPLLGTTQRSTMSLANKPTITTPYQAHGTLMSSNVYYTDYMADSNNLPSKQQDHQLLHSETLMQSTHSSHENHSNIAQSTTYYNKRLQLSNTLIEVGKRENTTSSVTNPTVLKSTLSNKNEYDHDDNDEKTKKNIVESMSLAGLKPDRIARTTSSDVLQQTMERMQKLFAAHQQSSSVLHGELTQDKGIANNQADKQVENRQAIGDGAQMKNISNSKQNLKESWGNLESVYSGISKVDDNIDSGGDNNYNGVGIRRQNVENKLLHQKQQTNEKITIHLMQSNITDDDDAAISNNNEASDSAGKGSNEISVKQDENYSADTTNDDIEEEIVKDVDFASTTDMQSAGDNELEIGEIDDVVDKIKDDVGNSTKISQIITTTAISSTSSSIELELSVGGQRAGGNNASDSGSDFWR